MGFPIVPLGISMLGTYLGSESVKKPNLVDPRAYADDLLYDDADISSDINMLGSKFTKRSNKAIGDIKQAGAANRLPEGAVISGIAGTQQEAAEGVSSIMPALKREKRTSHANFLNMVNQYETTKAGYDQAQTDRNLAGLGNLGKIATLWSAGYLN
jgi:hypothetical protein